MTSETPRVEEQLPLQRWRTPRPAGGPNGEAGNAPDPHVAELLHEIHHLREALRTRGVIEQAKGILMAQQRCTADEAFALLVRHSQNHNRKLRDIAAEIVARVSDRRDGTQNDSMSQG